MAKLKTMLFYLGGLVVLVVASFWVPGASEEDLVPPQGEPLPTATLFVPPPPTPTAEVAACMPTPRGITYGYRADAPFTTALAPPDMPGTRLTITGTVFAADCETPLPNALVEVWQADTNGDYDFSKAWLLRGQFVTDAQGQYQFDTIRPGFYKTGYEFLPAFIQVRVTHENQTLSTQLFFENDPFLRGFWSALPPLVVSLSGSDSDGLSGQFDIILPESASLR